MQDTDSDVRTISPVDTSITAFIGRALTGPFNQAVPIYSFSEFLQQFNTSRGEVPLKQAVADFFNNGGRHAVVIRTAYEKGDSVFHSYLKAFNVLRDVDIFNLLCLPPPKFNSDIDKEVLKEALELCINKNALLLIDPRRDWRTICHVTHNEAGFSGLDLPAKKNAVIFYPFINKRLRFWHIFTTRCVPCGSIAGVMARTDTYHNVWKSPAGTSAVINGISGLSLSLSDQDSQDLMRHNINSIRIIKGHGPCVWGARTLSSDGDFAYIAVTRLYLFIVESIRRGTQWGVFEPSNDNLFATIHRQVSNFMARLYRQGAFNNMPPGDAYYVKCDNNTNTPSHAERGEVVVEIGFAPNKPGVFIHIRIIITALS